MSRKRFNIKDYIKGVVKKTAPASAAPKNGSFASYYERNGSVIFGDFRTTELFAEGGKVSAQKFEEHYIDNGALIYGHFFENEKPVTPELAAGGAVDGAPLPDGSTPPGAPVAGAPGTEAGAAASGAAEGEEETGELTPPIESTTVSTTTVTQGAPKPGAAPVAAAPAPPPDPTVGMKDV